MEPDLKGYPVRVRLEVRLRDLDPLGHVHHAVHLSYVSPASISKGSPPVARGGAVRGGTHLGEEVWVGAKAVGIGRSSLRMAYHPGQGGGQGPGA